MPAKGQINNPKGRPKRGNTVAEIVRELLGEIDHAEKKTRRKALVLKVYGQAMAGDPASQKLLFNYDGGMPVQMTVNANADDETTKAMQEHARKIFGSKRDAK